MRILLLALVPQFFIGAECGGVPPAVNDSPGSEVAAGDAHACAVKSGVVSCWGANDHGQLGRGTVSAAEPVPATVTLPELIAQLAPGGSSTCARTVSGKVWCWGADAHGQLGRQPVGDSAMPVEVKLPVPIAQLSAGADFVLAVGSDGRLFGWGNDSEGVLAQGGVPVDLKVVAPAERAAFNLSLSQVSAGQGSACGLGREGTLSCWGRNSEGEYGLVFQGMQSREPVKVTDHVDAVSSGDFCNCWVTGGKLFCGGTLALANGTTRTFDATQPEPLGATPRLPRYRFLHGCVLDDRGGVWCHGRNDEGQLGLADTTPRSALTHVADAVTSLTVGNFFTCTMNAAQVVSCTGENAVGQLGLGDTNRRDQLTPQ